MYNAFVLNAYVKLRKGSADKEYCYQTALLQLADHISLQPFKTLQDAHNFQYFWRYARNDIHFTQMLETTYQEFAQKKTNLKLVQVRSMG